MKKDRLTYWEWLDDEVDMSRVPCCDLFDLDNMPEEERDGVEKLLRRCAELEDDDGTVEAEVKVLQRDVENLTRTLEEANDEIKALETENAELKAKLNKAVELPYVRRDCELTQIVYRNNDGNIEEETYFHDCYYGACHDVRGDVYAEARLAELKGEKK